MNVTVHLFATFREGRFPKEIRELAENTSLAAVVAELGIARGELGICLVNGRHAPLEQELNEGDDIYLSPMLAGG